MHGEDVQRLGQQRGEFGVVLADRQLAGGDDASAPEVGGDRRLVAWDAVLEGELELEAVGGVRLVAGEGPALRRVGVWVIEWL